MLEIPRLAILFVLFSLGLPAFSAGATPWNHQDLRGDVFYQIFVRSFADSDGDGVGDFRGLTAKLDYLNDADPNTTSDLGIEGIWLMPIFESPSYHGYDTVDYLSIDREYGSLADFREFLAAAHRRGIRVIVDFVMNHSSAQHPWFQASAMAPLSPYRDWYVWRSDDPGWTQPWGGGKVWHRNPFGDGQFYYGVFWGGMPDLNFAHPPVREEMKRLAEHWRRLGVDGFRLDATRHLFANGPGEAQNDQPETREFLREFASHLRELAPDTILVGENWTTTQNIALYFGDSSQVAGGDQLPMNFNFPLADAIVKGLREETSFGIREVLDEMAELYPAGVLDAPFLRNHDMMRLGTELGGDHEKQKLAAAILLTLPGVPFLYYGEEVGLQNGGPDRDDRLKRTPMPWNADEGGGFTTGKSWFPFAPGRDRENVATQQADPQSLLSFYQRLLRLRAQSPVLRHGELEALPAGGSDLLVFLRRHAGDAILVVHNLTAQERGLTLPAGLTLAAAPAWGEARRVEGRLTLAPRASVVWPLQNEEQAVLRVEYLCPGGERFVVVFASDGQSVELHQGGAVRRLDTAPVSVGSDNQLFTAEAVFFGEGPEGAFVAEGEVVVLQDCHRQPAAPTASTP